MQETVAAIGKSGRKGDGTNDVSWVRSGRGGNRRVRWVFPDCLGRNPITTACDMLLQIAPKPGLAIIPARMSLGHDVVSDDHGWGVVSAAESAAFLMASTSMQAR